MVLIVCLTVSAGYVYATGGTAGKIVDDAAITTEINDKIVKDPNCSFSRSTLTRKKETSP
jgi:hypothetical protein